MNTIVIESEPSPSGIYRPPAVVRATLFLVFGKREGTP
jgi:hypothetical protein